jgi:GNAT superfamily N-acetyltransferase
MPSLPGPVPVLPGATWRPLTLDDVAAYVRLHEEARVADAGSEVMTEEVARHELTDPTCPPATNTLALVLPDGSLAASIMAHERLQGIESACLPVGITHPACRGLGIARPPRLGERPGGRDLAGQPAELSRIVEAFRRCAWPTGGSPRSAGLPAYGALVFEMRRDLGQPLPDMPDLGPLRIEPYLAADAERLRLAHNEAFADHWGSEPLTPEMWGRDFVGDPFFRGDLSFVAFDGEEVTGYAVNYVAEPDWEATGVREGWVGQLGVRRPWRKRGLATALLVRSMSLPAAGLSAIPGRGHRQPDRRPRRLRARRLPPSPLGPAAARVQRIGPG